ncbi:hypothetical protein [Kitasatospora sp. NPDC089509]|uniref:hypothetical protein n=1 Tax=Kitasatospora sp. NPDC089509 TaxID=3364079 RepID=UPI00380AF342
MVRLAADWPRLVREQNLSAAAWALVREEVSARCDGPHGLWEADALHRLLPSAAADAAVLHYQLGMQLTETADLMGVEPSTAAGLVLAAERSLPKAAGEQLAFRSTGA